MALTSPMGDRLRDKVAIVTGAGRGIGRATARRLVAEGALVCVADVDEATASETAKLLAEEGGRTLAVQVDVGEQGAVEAMVRQTVDELGPIDVLVNNAQRVPPPTPAEDVTAEEWDPVDASGARATWLCCQAVFPHLRERGGSIVNFTSAAGLVGAPWLLPYAATKGAIIAMTYTMAQEWGRYGIRVNAVAPAAMTPATDIWVRQLMERVERTGEPPPAGVATSDPNVRLTTSGLDPEKTIAPAVAFLASDDACHVTGQTLCVDGGVVMH